MEPSVTEGFFINGDIAKRQTTVMAKQRKEKASDFEITSWMRSFGNSSIPNNVAEIRLELHRKLVEFASLDAQSQRRQHYKYLPIYRV